MDFIYDKYRENRGNYSRFLLLICTNCHNNIAIYQKDGPGPLKRLYKDRIKRFLALTESDGSLICGQCNSNIGNLYTYEKENRFAFLLDLNSIQKKVISKKAAESFS